jgi:hypothetical protein
MRVFLGTTEIAGYYRGLHRSLREIGVDSVYACGGHPFGYDGGAEEPQPWPVRLFRKISGMRMGVPKTNRLKRAFLKAASLLARMTLLLWALFKCDVFVFSFGTCLLTIRELRLFRLLGKRTIHVFHGSDNRPCYMDGGIVQPDTLENMDAVLRLHRQQHRRVKLIEKHSSCLVSHPATAQYFERPYVNWLLSTGIPFAGEGMETGERDATPGGPVTILHCPSHPALKGTEHIRGLIARLRTQGHVIDYRELINRPNTEVLQELRNCDFVIDQAYADYPMAGFATEAAHFGKPAVVGGYAREICGHIERFSGMPCDLYCLPEEMERVTLELITDPEYRQRCGQKARAFVTSAWSRQTVAQNWLRLLQANVPEEWMVKPGQVEYPYGCGLSVDGLIQSLVLFLRDGGGPGILFMEHHQELKAALLALSRERSSADRTSEHLSTAVPESRR